MCNDLKRVDLSMGAIFPAKASQVKHNERCGRPPGRGGLIQSSRATDEPGFVFYQVRRESIFYLVGQKTRLFCGPQGLDQGPLPGEIHTMMENNIYSLCSYAFVLCHIMHCSVLLQDLQQPKPKYISLHGLSIHINNSGPSGRFVYRHFPVNIILAAIPQRNGKTVNLSGATFAKHTSNKKNLNVKTVKATSFCSVLKLIHFPPTVSPVIYFNVQH